jgi:hypothetical protein
MNSSLIALLTLILGGGSGRLLDYVPSDMYWRDREVPLTVEALAPMLKIEPAPDASGAIADLGAADPHVRDAAAEKIVGLGSATLAQVQEAEASPAAEISQRARALVGQLTILAQKDKIRRLMAVRALGESGDPAAIPILRPLTESNERFVAQYAREALAEIEVAAKTPPGAQTRPALTNQPATSSAGAIAAATRPPANGDVWLLPSGCRAVGAVIPRGRGPIDFKFAEAHLPVRSNQEPKVVVEQIARLALSVAEQIGDVRIDSLTAGVSGDIGEDSGFVVLIAAGEFDSQAAIALAQSARISSRIVDGVQVFQPDGESAFFIPSDRRLVMLAAPEGEKYPLQEMIAAVRNNKGGIKTVPEMARLVKSVDTTESVWAVAQMTDAYRALIPLQGIDTLTLVGQKTPDRTRLIARGDAKDVDAAKSAANQVTEMAQDAATEMKVVEPIVPAIKAAEAFFASVQCTAENKRAMATADVTDSPAALFIVPLMLTFGDHSEVIPPPPRPNH